MTSEVCKNHHWKAVYVPELFDQGKALTLVYCTLLMLDFGMQTFSASDVFCPVVENLDLLTFQQYMTKTPENERKFMNIITHYIYVLIV